MSISEQVLAGRPETGRLYSQFLTVLSQTGRLPSPVCAGWSGAGDAGGSG